MQGVVHLFGVVKARRTFSNHIITEIARCVEFSHRKLIEPQLLEPHHYRDSKVFRVLSHEFRVVRQYRTFSIYIGTGVQGAYALVRGGSSTSNLVEPCRTTSLQGL